MLFVSFCRFKKKRDDEEMASRRSKQATPPAASSSCRCSLLFLTVLVLTAAPGVRSQQSDSNSNNNDLFQCPEGLSCFFSFVSSFLLLTTKCKHPTQPHFCHFNGASGSTLVDECVCQLVVDNNLTCRRRRRRHKFLVLSRAVGKGRC